MGCCPRSSRWWATRCAQTCCLRSRSAGGRFTLLIRSPRDPGRQRLDRGTKVHPEPSQVWGPYCRFWTRRKARRLKGERSSRYPNRDPQHSRCREAAEGQRRSAGRSLLQVLGEVLVHLEHSHAVFAEHLLQLVVGLDLALVLRVLEVVLLDVVPNLAHHLRPGQRLGAHHGCKLFRRLQRLHQGRVDLLAGCTLADTGALG